MDTTTSTREFFDTYTEALLARDASALAYLYAVPALILFPGNAVPVSDAAQTEQFFAGAFGQYAGVTEASAEVTVVAQTGHSAWAEVTWSYDGAAGERNMYQLVRVDDAWRIAVLTPLGT